jgi:hypothetical protein
MKHGPMRAMEFGWEMLLEEGDSYALRGTLSPLDNRLE